MQSTASPKYTGTSNVATTVTTARSNEPSKEKGYRMT